MPDLSVVVVVQVAEHADPGPVFNEQSPGTFQIVPCPAAVLQINKTPDVREGFVAAAQFESQVHEGTNVVNISDDMLAMEDEVLSCGQ